VSPPEGFSLLAAQVRVVTTEWLISCRSKLSVIAGFGKERGGNLPRNLPRGTAAAMTRAGGCAFAPPSGQLYPG
jgi:hypothetical protein